MSLTQPEYEYIIGLDKSFKDNTDILLGPSPLAWSREIVSNTSKDEFLLDFYRGSLEIAKYTYNKRFRKTIILLRYDAVGRHTNPPDADGRTFDGPHVHLYREGFGDRCAFSVSQIGLTGSESMIDVLTSVLHFCNINSIPPINQSLF